MRRSFLKVLTGFALLVTTSAPATLAASPLRGNSAGDFECWYLGEYSLSYEERWDLWYCDDGDGGHQWLFYIPV